MSYPVITIHSLTVYPSQATQNKELILKWSQGCLQDSGVFIEHSLITITSLMSIMQ